MPKDPTRNIVRYKIGGSHLNEFEFHKHQGEMAEEFQPPGDESRETGPRTQAERVAQIMAAAKRKAAKNKRRKAKASEAKPAAANQKTKGAARPAGKRAAKARTGKKAGKTSRAQKAPAK